MNDLKTLLDVSRAPKVNAPAVGEHLSKAEFTQSAGTVEVPVAAAEGDALAFLEKSGQNPAEWEVTGFRRIEYGRPEDPSISTRFTYKRRAGSDYPHVDIDELLETFDNHQPLYRLVYDQTQTGEPGGAVLIGDNQFGKGIADPFEALAHARDAIDAIADDLVLRGGVEELLVAFLGDHVEGFVSQGGANVWRTKLTLSEQIRATRRMMAYALERFYPLADRLVMAAIPGNHGECYDDQTEFLTDRGWVRGADYRGGRFATISPDTHEFVWQEPTAWLDQPYSGRMIHQQSVNTDLMVTPNHDLYTSKRDSAILCTPASFAKRKAGNEIEHNGRRYTLQAAGAWRGVQHLPVIPDHVDSMGRTRKAVQFKDPMHAARFLGWYVAEGWVDAKGSYRIHMAQSPEVHPENYEEIVRLVEDFGLTTDRASNQVRFSNTALGRWLVDEFGTYSGDKHLPAWLKSWPTELLAEFMLGYEAGDGHRYSETGVAFKSKSRQLVDDLQEVAIKLGLRMAIGKERQYPVAGTDHVGSAIEFAINTRSTTVTTAAHMSEEFYDGRIYCPTVPNGLVVVRRNGKVAVSGNSQRFNGKGVTTYDDNHDVEALNAVAEAAQMSREYSDVEFYVPQVDELSLVVEVGGVRWGLVHGDRWRAGKHFDWWAKQSFGGKPLAGAEVLVCGHWHHLLIEEAGEKLFIQTPALETESTWFEHAAGTRGNPGAVLAVTDGDRVSDIKVIRVKAKEVSA